MTPRHDRRRWLVPEVVQTSSMDCGPAALKSLLEGYGVRVGYGRLREVCQTSVDGTSIDALEAIANQLGLRAAQVMIPADHVLLPETSALPGIVVTALPGGAMHFVLIWSRHGRWVQVMDPATGRRWVKDTELLKELHVNLTPVPAAAWREWAGSEEFLAPLRSRIRALGASPGEVTTLVGTAQADETWRSLSTLDAAVRMVDQLVTAGGVRRGADAMATCRAIAAQAIRDPELIRRNYWSAMATDPDEDGEPRVMLIGSVLVSVQSGPHAAAEHDEEPVQLVSREAMAALTAEAPGPSRKLLAVLREDGLLAPMVCGAALTLSAVAVLVEALLFRGAFYLGDSLSPGGQRLGAMAALVAFLVAMVLLDVPIAATVLRLGRHLEVRLRAAYLAKLPRLADRYFHSRLASDMAERGHMLQLVREVPGLGARMIRAVFSLVLTVCGIACLDPASAPLAVVVAISSFALPLVFQPLLTERDLRMRTYEGALTRFYFDALLGLMPVRAHGADRAVRRQHESMLVDWQAAGLRVQFAAISIAGVLGVLGMGLSALLVASYVANGEELAGVLLLAFWALQLPTLGAEVATLSRQYPAFRNVTHRVMELLLAPEEQLEDEDDAVDPSRRRAAHEVVDGAPAGPMTVRFDGVSAKAGGHTILEDIDLEIAAGSHVAIVGRSGAGKSSLVGLLLGWHRPSAGQLFVDGRMLTGAHLARVRQETAWVDPDVYLWNQSLFENLRYGLATDHNPPIGGVLQAADLRGVLERLPEGLQTPLGEAGALVSGGEGQRVRLGRSLLRPNSRLVILDEPFRGLDRSQRHELLERARATWKDATLLCITHDISETLDFDRVILMEDGRIVEDGHPATLGKRVGSAYHALLTAETSVRGRFGTGRQWRRWTLIDGRIEEDPHDVAPRRPDVEDAHR